MIARLEPEFPERPPEARPGLPAPRSSASASWPRSKERLRLLLEVELGERRLLPTFGCGVHRLHAIRGLRDRELAASLIERAIDRWLPELGVRRVELCGVESFAAETPDRSVGTSADPRRAPVERWLRVALDIEGERRELDLAWWGGDEHGQ